MAMGSGIEQAAKSLMAQASMRGPDSRSPADPPPPSALDSVKAEIEEMGVVILRLREKLVPILHPEQPSEAVEKTVGSTAIFDLAHTVREYRLTLDRLIECIDL